MRIVVAIVDGQNRKMTVVEKFDGHEVINITINMKAQMDVVGVLQRNN